MAEPAVAVEHLRTALAADPHPFPHPGRDLGRPSDRPDRRFARGPRVRQASPVRRAVEWMFRSRIDGQIVIVQRPNLSLWIFVVARVTHAFLDAGTRPASCAQAVATLAIVWWGAHELVPGVNPWRRLLGTTLLAVQVVALLR